MTWTEILTLLGFLLNLAALVFVGYQIRQNTTSIGLAKQSMDEQRKTMQVNMLPRGHYVISVQSHLQMWRDDLEKVSDALEVAIRDQDDKILKSIAENARKSPKGLIYRIQYEHAPEWLRAIWMAGAQYYYDFQAPLLYLWDAETEKANWHLAEEVIKRGREHSCSLGELLTYIDQAVPTAWANSPASIDDEQFLS